MGKKIFVSYKYADDNVKALPYNYYELAPIKTTARNYVDKLEEKIGKNDIYKGENNGEDLSIFKDETIKSKLKDKIFDSSITIVLISPNMKELLKKEEEQWIPQEISYSLKEITRNGRTSKTNALICVVLPDRNGNYNYYINGNSWFNCYNNYITFNIISSNQNNKKNGIDDYEVTVKWDDFIQNYNKYIDEAVRHQDDIDNYNIVKII